jgi:hypothetical protein
VVGKLTEGLAQILTRDIGNKLQMGLRCFGRILVVEQIDRRLFVRFFLRHRRKWEDDEQKVFKIAQQIVKLQYAVALDCTHVADSQQPGKSSPAVTSCWIGDNVRRAIAKDKSRACDQAQIRKAGCFVLLGQRCRSTYLFFLLKNGVARFFRGIV